MLTQAYLKFVITCTIVEFFKFLNSISFKITDCTQQNTKNTYTTASDFNKGMYRTKTMGDINTGISDFLFVCYCFSFNSRVFYAYGDVTIVVERSAMKLSLPV